MTDYVVKCRECGKLYVVSPKSGDVRYCPECKAKKEGK